MTTCDRIWMPRSRALRWLYTEGLMLLALAEHKLTRRHPK